MQDIVILRGDGYVDVYVGGSFTNAGGIPEADYIAKWDGSNWSALGGTPLNLPVWDLHVVGTDLYVGGAFTNAGGNANADYVARWNGSAWSSLGTTPLNADVNSITGSGSSIYIGGNFTNAGGNANADFVAKWNGTDLSAVNSTPLNSSVLTMALLGKDLYVGGLFDNAGGVGNADYIARLDGNTNSWTAVGSGTLGGPPLGNGLPYVLVSDGTSIYVGGDFTDAGNIAAADYLAKWNGSAWSAVGSPALNGAVWDIFPNGSTVYVAGDFTNAGSDANADHLAQWNGSAWQSVNATPLNASAGALAMNGSSLYVGGLFTNVGGDPYADYIYEFTDAVPPTVSSITRTGTSPTAAASVNFTVTFSEAVTGVNASDFTPAMGGGLTGASVTGVTGSGMTYTVTVNTGSGSGTLGLNLTDNDSIVDASSNPLGGAGAGNGNFTGETYTVDKTAPAVTSIVRADANPTSAASVDFTVTFSEAVTGVDASDFTPAMGGGLTGASVTGVSGSGTTYTVTVNTGTGSGTLGLNLTDNDSIVDALSNPLGGPGAGNGNFSGETYTVEKDAPTVTAITRANTNPTAAASVNFTVTFSEAVTGVDASDFTPAMGGGLTGASVTGVSGSGTTYTVTVDTGAGSGTLGLNLTDDDSIVDALSNPLGGAGAGNGNFTGQVYSVRTATFADVPVSYWAWQPIERLYAAGITGGCAASPLIYCPANNVTRAQMAVFLERGMNGPLYTPPAGTGLVFADVPLSYWAVSWIEDLYADGITGGCGNSPLRYCPENPVTRAQMAVFLLKAKYGPAYTPPNVGPTFGDTAGHWAEDWIEQLAQEGITSGCGGGNYCPENPVTRAQMAVFLVITFGLP